MGEEELISKRELLRAVKISYGTLYRWKRMNLIPESWFIHKATRTGQATFFPKERIMTRVEKIQELKSELSVAQIREVFSSNIKSFLIPMGDFIKLNMVSKLTITAFSAVFANKEKLSFDDVFSMYVVDHLMRLSGIYLEDAKQVLRMLTKYLSKKDNKEYQLILVRKMGIPLMLLVSGEDEILLEESAEIIASANLAEFEDALRDQLIS